MRWGRSTGQKDQHEMLEVGRGVISYISLAMIHMLTAKTKLILLNVLPQIILHYKSMTC